MCVISRLSSVSSQFRLLRGEVDDHRAGLHRLDRVPRDQLRRGAARHGGRRDHDVEVGESFLQRLLLLGLLLGCQLLRAASSVSSPRTPRSRNVAPRRRPAPPPRGERRTRTRLRRAAALWRSPAGRRRLPRSRACAQARPCPPPSSASGRASGCGRRRGSRPCSPRSSPGTRASIDWARVIRGIDSMANATTPLACRRAMPSASVSGSRNPTKATPGRNAATSSAVGFATRTIPSAASVGAWSASWTPPPRTARRGSLRVPGPSLHHDVESRRLKLSGGLGVRATRFSPGADSRGTHTRMCTESLGRVPAPRGNQTAHGQTRPLRP